MLFHDCNSLYFEISLKFTPESPIDSRSGVVQVMAWHSLGTKPLPTWNNVDLDSTCRLAKMS